MKRVDCAEIRVKVSFLRGAIEAGHRPGRGEFLDLLSTIDSLSSTVDRLQTEAKR